jgi:hypothetical protein
MDNLLVDQANSMLEACESPEVYRLHHRLYEALYKIAAEEGVDPQLAPFAALQITILAFFHLGNSGEIARLLQWMGKEMLLPDKATEQEVPTSPLRCNRRAISKKTGRRFSAAKTPSRRLRAASRKPIAKRTPPRVW